ncbi:APC family permease [Microbacterium azadirachtae]|uniref:Amino acid transporter n=1 Tax=Microbacterium azadirachtae TaxID=582680 RepID=A0A1I6G6J1_9MICO|nr:APC family permease [Microbacterium azadirachtae]SDL35664.1 Amino acid transporter [Microbacterium azadirachtae]SEF66376.1 Amino acid transporter [Microbacterium azadirachtae]SEF67141.1 Amino acid transporter [Microbacterium azadirachtae]SFR37770.1 Amino acid transporter [Microbacterium azadirachtae]
MTHLNTPPVPAPFVDGTPTKGLAIGKLGLWGSTVIGVASTAPLFSLAATLGFVVVAVGAQAPVAFVLAFVPMLFTAFAYRELNNDVPDCGTVFTWAAKAFGPRTGWMAGWSIAVAGVLVMANLAEIAAAYLLRLVGDGSLADNRVVVTASGCVVIAVMTWVSLRGIQIGERMQQMLLAIQYLAMAAFVIGCLVGFFTGNAPKPTAPALDWFNPLLADGHGMVQAVLLALFIYWGWDTCLALTEETRDPRRTPGRAATLSTVILLITYVGLTVVTMMYAGIGDTGTGLANADHADDVFSGLAGMALGPMGWFLVVAVAVSALSSSQTTILPTARGTFAMGIYKALPKRFAALHPVTQTPTFSTLLIGVVAILYYAGMNLVSTSVLSDSVLSIGLAIAFFYGIASFTCIWYFRRNLFDTWQHLIYRLIFPLLGGVFMAWAFIQSAFDMADPAYGSSHLAGIGSAFLIGIGSLLLGAVLMFVWALFPGARDYFQKRSLNRDTEVLAPE